MSIQVKLLIWAVKINEDSINYLKNKLTDPHNQHEADWVNDQIEKLENRNKQIKEKIIMKKHEEVYFIKKILLMTKPGLERIIKKTYAYEFNTIEEIEWLLDRLNLNGQWITALSVEDIRKRIEEATGTDCTIIEPHTKEDKDWGGYNPNINRPGRPGNDTAKVVKIEKEITEKDLIRLHKQFPQSFPNGLGDAIKKLKENNG